MLVVQNTSDGAPTPVICDEAVVVNQEEYLETGSLTGERQVLEQGIVRGKAVWKK